MASAEFQGNVLLRGSLINFFLAMVVYAALSAIAYLIGRHVRSQHADFWFYSAGGLFGLLVIEWCCVGFRDLPIVEVVREQPLFVEHLELTQTSGDLLFGECSYLRRWFGDLGYWFGRGRDALRRRLMGWVVHRCHQVLGRNKMPPQECLHPVFRGHGLVDDILTRRLRASFD